MVAKKKTTKKRKHKLKQGLKYEFYGLLMLSFFIIGLPINGFGVIGYSIHSFMRFFAGHWDFVLSIFGIYSALYVMVKRNFPFPWTVRKTGILLIFLALLTFQHLEFANLLEHGGQYTDVNIFKATWQQLSLDRAEGFRDTVVGGGMIGALIYSVFHYLFDDVGTLIMIITSVLVGILFTFHISYVDFIKKIKAVLSRLLFGMNEKLKEAIYLLGVKLSPKGKKIHNENPKENTKDENSLSFTIEEDNGGIEPLQEEPIIHDFLDRTQTEEGHLFDSHNVETNLESEQKSESIQSRKIDHDVSEQDEGQDININGIPLEKIKEEEENYLLPPFKILNRPSIVDKGTELRDITSNAKKLEATLESFGVKAKVTQINRGPAVTRYEIQPDIGVKVSRIVNLSDDLALALAAKDIRIEAPIPGKAAIGIEVPNTEVAIVTLREVLESARFFEAKSKLSISLGRDITGDPIIGDLAKMPHLLVAGATGSGKSVCINGIITSVLFKAKPSEVKFLMIDPKMVELNIYNGIPHLLTPVVTNPKKASKALKMIVNEMERRYEKFAEKNARNIEGYNSAIIDQASDEEVFPYIVVIIDELADLMMIAPNDVEDAIIRLAQKARAAGIHLIVATQRPSVDVITGLIKANIPSRIAFGVSSQTDSRTILDMGGAEKLLGRGDMLYLPVGFSKPVRVQGAFISDTEVEEVVTFVKEQQSVNYQEDLIPDLNASTENDLEESPEDEYFNDAVQLVVENNQASVSLLQRRLRIGYTRAARLIDEMEDKGIVGPYEGSKPRKVLINNEQSKTLTS